MPHLGVEDPRHDARQLFEVCLTRSPPTKQAAREEKQSSIQPVTSVFPLPLNLHKEEFPRFFFWGGKGVQEILLKKMLVLKKV